MSSVEAQAVASEEPEVSAVVTPLSPRRQSPENVRHDIPVGYVDIHNYRISDSRPGHVEDVRGILNYDIFHSGLSITTIVPVESELTTSSALIEPESIDLECCGICREEYVNKVKLHCGHSYCAMCILEWGVRANTCPMCRTLIYPDARMTQREILDDDDDGRYDEYADSFVNPNLDSLISHYLHECLDCVRIIIRHRKEILAKDEAMACLGEENARLNKELHHGEDPIEAGGNIPRRRFNIKAQIINDIIEVENKWNIKSETSDKRMLKLAKVSQAILEKYYTDIKADKCNYIAGNCAMTSHYKEMPATAVIS